MAPYFLVHNKCICFSERVERKSNMENIIQICLITVSMLVLYPSAHTHIQVAGKGLPKSFAFQGKSGRITSYTFSLPFKPTRYGPWLQKNLFVSLRVCAETNSPFSVLVSPRCACDPAIEQGEPGVETIVICDEIYNVVKLQS